MVAHPIINRRVAYATRMQPRSVTPTSRGAIVVSRPDRLMLLVDVGPTGVRNVSAASKTLVCDRLNGVDSENRVFGSARRRNADCGNVDAPIDGMGLPHQFLVRHERLGASLLHSRPDWPQILGPEFL